MTARHVAKIRIELQLFVHHVLVPPRPRPVLHATRKLQRRVACTHPEQANVQQPVCPAVMVSDHAHATRAAYERHGVTSQLVVGVQAEQIKTRLKDEPPQPHLVQMSAPPAVEVGVPVAPEVIGLGLGRG